MSFYYIINYPNVRLNIALIFVLAIGYGRIRVTVALIAPNLNKYKQKLSSVLVYCQIYHTHGVKKLFWNIHKYYYTRNIIWTPLNESVINREMLTFVDSQWSTLTNSGQLKSTLGDALLRCLLVLYLTLDSE